MLKKLPLEPVRPLRVFLRKPRLQTGIHLLVLWNNSGKAPFAGPKAKFTLFGNQFVAVGLEVP